VKRVTGLGGVFFKAKDPKAMYEWYKEHLGIQGEPGSGAMFHWREELFAVMARNAQRATAFFRLPANRVVELGMQIEL